MNKALKNRFRHYQPVVVDVETAGFNCQTDALLEVALIIVKMNEQGRLYFDKTIHHHILPFPNANLEESALKFNKIDPYHPFRFAVDEKKALRESFDQIYEALKESGCHRAVLVGHNPMFDLSFINAAAQRCKLKKNPFHRFTTFDTATLGGLAYGQTVLARAVRKAGITFDQEQAHSAIYDAERTAELFCKIINTWDEHITIG